MANLKFDIKDFRRALGKFPTGVTIITIKNQGGEPVGVTASSFNSVSVEPPLILWSVDKGAYSAEMFISADHFAINVLSKSQMDMSNLFARRGAEKFNGIDFRENKYGVPLFNDCAAQFECKTWNVYDGGDHYIIVGEVEEYCYSEAEMPLVFSCGSYAISMQHPATVDQEKLRTPEEGLLGDYLLYLLRIAYTRCSSQLYPQLLEQFDVIPEEWRVLTLLGDGGNTEKNYLAEMIGQPLDEFNATYERMRDKGYVVPKENDQLELTDQGRDMTKRVFDLAKAQEAMMLDSMDSQQAKDMKAGLKKIISSVS